LNDFTEKQIKDIAYFKSHLEEFLNNELLKDKHVVISDEKIQKSFDTFVAAADYAIDNFKPGNFIIQEIVDPKKIINFVKAAIV
jgi:hypothetical protein